MNFKEAYEQMKKGRKVSRSIYNNSYWYLDNDKIFLKCANGGAKHCDFSQIAINDTLADDWEIVAEKNRSKVWKPKPDDLYYCLLSTGQVESTTFCRHYGADEDRVKLGNCFETKEEAEHMVEKLKVIKELQDFALENNNEEIDWRDKYTTKYFISYDFNEEKILTTGYTYFWTSNIYFASKEIAQEAIKKISEDRIKKYYFDIED